VPAGFAGYWWYTDAVFAGYARALRVFMVDATTTFPLASSLPQLRLPDTLASEHATLPKQATVLSMFAKEQRELTAG
jgi:hypothetical protein